MSSEAGVKRSSSKTLAPWLHLADKAMLLDEAISMLFDLVNLRIYYTE
jgi:hypothetical protein